MKDKIIILEDDITTLEVEALICQANTDLEMCDEISALILERGGDAVLNECNVFENLQKGGAVITPAGNLPAVSIIHAIIYSLGEEEETEEENLMQAIRNSLNIAKDKKYTMIAMPLVGSENAGIPIKRAAEIIMAEVKKHLDGETTLENVYFVAHKAVIYEAFEEAYKQL